MLKNLMKYKMKYNIQKFIYSYIATMLSTKSEIKEIKHYFEYFDTKNDGIIDFEEFSDCFKNILPDIKNDKISKTFNSIINDSSKLNITHNDFLAN